MNYFNQRREDNFIIDCITAIKEDYEPFND